MSENTLLIPKVNSQGVFKFYPPFDKPEYDGKSYKVLSIRTIESLEESEEDPFGNIYLANGMTSKDFSNDFTNHVPIIELIYNEIETLYIPASKIKDMPPLYGYKYTPRMVTFKLGPIYDDFNLTALYNNITELIKDTLGVEASALESPYGDTVLINETEHNKNLKFIYGNGSKLNKSYATLYKELSRRYDILKTEHDVLERGIAKLLTDKDSASIIESN